MQQNKISLNITKNTFASILLLCVLFVIFFNATKGFSYDYQYYLMYIDEIKQSELSNLFDKRIGIYIPLQFSTGGVEIGFVILVKLFSYFTLNSTIIYASLATISLYIKSRVMFFFNIKWYWVYLILIYSCVLLEGNALRSGISLSFFLLSMQCYFRNKFTLMVFLWGLACFLHIQSLYFIIFFSLILLFNITNLILNRWLIIFITVLVLCSGIILSILFQSMISSEKLAIYALKGTESGGLNLVSMTSLVLLGISLSLIINSIWKGKSVREENKTYIGLMLVSLSTLSIYIFFTSVAVVGDRLWQWGFIIFCVSYFGIYKRKTFILSKAILLICFLVNIINITYRYPLTNIFYPIQTYTDFSNI